MQYFTTLGFYSWHLACSCLSLLVMFSIVFLIWCIEFFISKMSFFWSKFQLDCWIFVPCCWISCPFFFYVDDFLIQVPYGIHLLVSVFLQIIGNEIFMWCLTYFIIFEVSNWGVILWNTHIAFLFLVSMLQFVHLLVWLLQFGGGEKNPPTKQPTVEGLSSTTIQWVENKQLSEITSVSALLDE